MKNMTFGELFWIIIGFLVVASAAVFIIGQVKLTQTDLDDKRPVIDAPPKVTTSSFHLQDDDSSTLRYTLPA